MCFRLYMLHGHLPHFSDQDNPASFSPHRSTRVMTFSYLCAFNSWLLVAPVVLCYDWQMGSIPLLEAIFDPRHLATITTMAVLIGLGWKIWCLPSVRANQRKNCNERNTKSQGLKHSCVMKESRGSRRCHVCICSFKILCLSKEKKPTTEAKDQA